VTGRQGGDLNLTHVNAGDNESFESLLKRFNKRVQQDGILAEIRHREYFEKNSIKRKRKEAAKKRKSAKAVATRTPTR
jgi:small subunit ribosomal protein S21